MPNGERILIVGAGIAGMATAIALSQNGFRPELIEKSPEHRTSGTGLALFGNATRVLAQLGVDAAGARLHGWRFLDTRGAVLCQTDLDALWGGVGECVGVERGCLMAALRDAVRSVPIRTGVTVASVTQILDEVHVAFSDCSEGTYDLVVGADGIYSSVRSILDGGAPLYAGQMVWRCIVDGSFVDNNSVVLGDGRFVGLVPVGRGRTYAFFGQVSPHQFKDPVQGRLSRLRERFCHFGSAVPACLAALHCDEQLRFDAIEWVEADCWTSGRVVLVGDAAHASPPHMGQGAAMALEDAVVLAECLSCTSVSQALGTYVARRQPRTTWVQQQSLSALAAWLLPAAVRDAALQARGDEILQQRYAPLRAPA